MKNEIIINGCQCHVFIPNEVPFDTQPSFRFVNDVKVRY